MGAVWTDVQPGSAAIVPIVSCEQRPGGRGSPAAWPIQAVGPLGQVSVSGFNKAWILRVERVVAIQVGWGEERGAVVPPAAVNVGPYLSRIGREGSLEGGSGGGRWGRWQGEGPFPSKPPGVVGQG